MLKKKIRGFYGESIVNKVYITIKSILKMDNEYTGIEFGDFTNHCWEFKKEANKLLHITTTKEVLKNFLDKFYKEGNLVDLSISYYVYNKVKKEEFNIGDKVVFATTAMGDNLMAYGKIIDINNSGEYKVDILNNRGCWCNSGNKDSRDTTYRWVNKSKIFHANGIEDITLKDIQIGDTVITNIDNNSVIAIVTSKKKTIRTNFNTKLSDKNFYKVKI